MSTATQHSAATVSKATRVAPSRVPLNSHYTLAQELQPFGTWVGEPIWVPPKDSSKDFAMSMLRHHGLLSSKCACWATVVEEHRPAFQQVREIDLHQASIRLPKGKLFVSVTEQNRFDEITDVIPNCVRTRLDEFMAGPGKRAGVKVYYLKPLCVELGDELVFTTRESVQAAIQLVQSEVFSAYRRLYLYHRPIPSLLRAVDAGLSFPRKVIVDYHQRKQKAIDAYQAQLEFSRRKLALRARNAHRRFRTDGCTFEEMLDLTNPLDRDDVIEQFGIEQQLSESERNRLKMAALQTLPWFVALSLGVSYATSVAASVALTVAPPLMVCDPAFVAEMPGSRGVVLKIGHFDEIGGITHIEI
jgi:hypothetical protein